MRVARWYARSAFPGYLPPGAGGESTRDTPLYAKSMPCDMFGESPIAPAGALVRASNRDSRWIGDCVLGRKGRKGRKEDQTRWSAGISRHLHSLRPFASFAYSVTGLSFDWGGKFRKVNTLAHARSERLRPRSSPDGCRKDRRQRRLPQAQACELRCPQPQTHNPQPASQTAAVTTISTRHSGLASGACTVARGGQWPCATQASHTAFMAGKSRMSDR